MWHPDTHVVLSRGDRTIRRLPTLRGGDSGDKERREGKNRYLLSLSGGRRSFRGYEKRQGYECAPSGNGTPDGEKPHGRCFNRDGAGDGRGTAGAFHSRHGQGKK